MKIGNKNSTSPHKKSHLRNQCLQSQIFSSLNNKPKNDIIIIMCEFFLLQKITSGASLRVCCTRSNEFNGFPFRERVAVFM